MYLKIFNFKYFYVQSSVLNVVLKTIKILHFDVLSVLIDLHEIGNSLI